MVSCELLMPPLTDPTCPYHSLVYIASFARANGYEEVNIRDTNIEALEYCADPEFLKKRKQSWQAELSKLAAKKSLAPLEQIRYSALSRTRGLDVNGPAIAIMTMRDAQKFWNFEQYERAAKQLQYWIECLGVDGIPFQFSTGFSLSGNSLFSLSSLEDMTNERLLDSLAQPFAQYFHKVLFPDLVDKSPDVIGISIGYTTQLPISLWLVRKLRKLLPDTTIVCGGTEVADIWKYLNKKQLFGTLFHGADACVIGEGETAFLTILKRLEENEPIAEIPNVVSISPDGNFSKPPSIFYEDVGSLPSPDYGLMKNSGYFAPENILYYSPTRGCYWNKCTFCDYGLNFGSPTSPWRQRDITTIIDDLKHAVRYSSFFYFSVDVLAPNALVKLAKAIVDAELDITWCAEIRLEKYFSRERCDLLRQSGCVAISVGFESGNQRILDLIKKGTKLSDVSITVQNFREAGIAVQMMAFTDFPTENYKEAQETIDYLQNHREDWTVSTLGEFNLTPGAGVALRPHQFEIENIASFDGADIDRILRFQTAKGIEKSEEEKRRIATKKKSISRSRFTRPFAGGVDTAHSILYYSRFGLEFPTKVQSTDLGKPFDLSAPIVASGILIDDEPFNEGDLVSKNELELLRSELLNNGKMPGYREFVKQLDDRYSRVDSLNVQNPVFYESNGFSLPCSEEVWAFLRHIDGEQSFDQLSENMYEQQGLSMPKPVVDFLIASGVITNPV